MLRRLSLRDVAIVSELEVDFGPGFSVLTGETGAGKSILVDALQLALGSRAEASLVREGAQRAEVAAEFDAPASLAGWLDEAGFTAEAALLLRRTVDAQGRSRAWINGSPATVTQLREVADHLVDIHGQHAWQSLTRPAAVRGLLDAQAGVDPAPLASAWQVWRDAQALLAQARGQGEQLARERERLAWQLSEVDKLAPGEDEWDSLNAEHQRLAHGQALLDGARAALEALRDGEPAADTLAARAVSALEDVTRYDAELQAVVDVLRQAQAQIDDAAHTLHAYLNHRDPDPERLAELDARLAAWISLARRYRRQPAELPALRAAWKIELASLDAANDLAALEQRADAAAQAWRREAQAVSRLRQRTAPRLGQAVTAAMQLLGMAGGRFEVALLSQAEPQAYGLEAVELRVAGHAGSTPRPLGKVASGGELSRLALAIAVTTAQGAAGAVTTAQGAAGAVTTAQGAAGAVTTAQGAAGAVTTATDAAPATLIFDEIDAGVGGTVADSVGRLMKQLGGSAQVLAVTHLAQVAACADGHFVVAKAAQGRQTTSRIQAVSGEARVAEVARMLGGEHLSSTSRAHAQALLTGASSRATPTGGQQADGQTKAVRGARGSAA
jgi:DNA repair protein RecN (Recombination protein N)